MFKQFVAARHDCKDMCLALAYEYRFGYLFAKGVCIKLSSHKLTVSPFAGKQWAISLNWGDNFKISFHQKDPLTEVR